MSAESRSPAQGATQTNKTATSRLHPSHTAGNNDLLLADYEELEQQYRSMCCIASHIALELPIAKVEQLLTAELPFHYNESVLADLVESMNGMVTDQDEQGVLTNEQ